METRAQRVLITGGCGGMGLGIAEYFAGMGKKVWLMDCDISTAERLQEHFEAIEAIELNIADHVHVEAEIKKLVDDGNSPEILINAAGMSPKYDASGNPWKTWTMPLNHWQTVMSVNIDAAFNLCRLVVPSMIENRYGRIVNIASLAARTGGSVAPVHYVTSKAAMLGLTKGVAKEVGEFGITVNAINPGRIDTPMIRDVSDEVNMDIAAKIPVGRLGTPQDIAGAIGYLCSDSAGFLTGTTIEVNGGSYMGP